MFQNFNFAIFTSASFAFAIFTSASFAGETLKPLKY